MRNILHIFLGNPGINQEKMEKKSIEAHDIKNKIFKDSLIKKERVDTINIKTYKKLLKISNDLTNVTYAIGVSTGAKERGMR